MIGGARAAVLSVAAMVLVAGSGCATTKQMALSKQAPAAVITPQQSLALATLRLSNTFKPDYQPHVQSVAVKGVGEQGERLAFQVGAPFRASEAEADQFEEFLVSMALPPGTYDVQSVFVRASGLLVYGSGFIQLNGRIQVPPAKAIYLGRIEAVRRERVGDEPRAGSVIPLIDQGVTGFSGGAFDVKVVDRYDEDLALLRAEFPALQQVAVEKALLPPPSQPAPEPAQAPAK